MTNLVSPTVSAILVILLWPAIGAAQSHPAMRYSCMSDPPPGVGWPMVDDRVPYAIERMHPGYEIQVFSGFTVPGVSLFQIIGRTRGDGAEDRYVDVEGVDDAGTVLTDRALFLRAAAGVTNATALAERAMAILLVRADAAPLTSGAGIHETTRDRVRPPSVADGTLTFWIRVRSDMPYATEITVELATGTHRGDWGG